MADVDKYRKDRMTRTRTLPGVTTSGYAELAHAYDTQIQFGKAAGKAALDWKKMGDDAYLAKLQLDGSRKAVELMAKHKHDPKGFEESWNTWQIAREQVQENERPLLGNTPTALLNEIGINTGSLIFRNHQEKIFEDNKKLLKLGFQDTASNIELSIARSEPITQWGEQYKQLLSSINNLENTPFLFPADIQTEIRNHTQSIVTSLAKKAFILDHKNFINDKDYNNLFSVDRLEKVNNTFKKYPTTTIINEFKKTGASDDELKLIKSIMESQPWSAKELDDIGLSAYNHVKNVIDQTDQLTKYNAKLEKELIDTQESKLELLKAKGQISIDEYIQQKTEINNARRTGGKGIGSISETNAGILKLNYRKEELHKSYMTGEPLAWSVDNQTILQMDIQNDGVNFQSMPKFFESVTSYDPNTQTHALNVKGQAMLKKIESTSLLPIQMNTWIRDIGNQNLSATSATHMALLGTIVGHVIENNVATTSWFDKSDITESIKPIAKLYTRKLANAYNPVTNTFDKDQLESVESWRVQKLIKMAEPGYKDRLKLLKNEITKDTINNVITNMDEAGSNISDWIHHQYHREGKYMPNPIDELKSKDTYPDFIVDRPGSIINNQIPDLDDKYLGLMRADKFAELQTIIEDNIEFLLDDVNLTNEDDVKAALNSETFATNLGKLLKDDYGLTLKQADWHRKIDKQIKKEQGKNEKWTTARYDKRYEELKEKYQYEGTDPGMDTRWFGGVFADYEGNLEWTFNDVEGKLNKQAQTYVDPNYDSIEDGKWYTFDIALQSMIPLTNDAVVAKLTYEKENKEKSFRPGGGYYSDEERNEIIDKGVSMEDFNTHFKAMKKNIKTNIDDPTNPLFPLKLHLQDRIKVDKVSIYSNSLRPYYYDENNIRKIVPGFTSPQGIYRPDIKKSFYAAGTRVLKNRVLNGHNDIGFVSSQISKILGVEKISPVLLTFPSMQLVNMWNDDTKRDEWKGFLLDLARSIEKRSLLEQEYFYKSKPGEFQKNFLQLIWGAEYPKEFGKEQREMKTYIEETFENQWQHLNLE
tara:strand:+ start:219 stop:3350 length:3132 start_codon:yes stop_codon:yes gene_type:complete